MKILLRIILAVLTLLVIALLLCVRPVDRTAYQQTGYFRKTLTELQAMQRPRPVKALLFAAAARAGITPPVGVPLAGFGARKGKTSVGVHDSLYVRIIALQADDRLVFIIGYDALLLHPDLARHIEQRAGLKPEQLYFTATHTHSGPGGWGHGFVEEQFSGPPDQRVADMLVDSTIAALQRAQHHMVPAQWRTGMIDAPLFIRNRLLGDKGTVDDDLAYLSLCSGGKPLAVLASYSAHATVLSERNMTFSGDYPGYLERRLEKETGAVALFAAAGLASHSHRGQGKDFARAKNIGEGLADSLLKFVYTESGRDSVALDYRRLTVATPMLQIRLNREYRLNSFLTRQFFHFSDSYISYLSLDDFLLLGSPAEFSGLLALQVKRAAAERGKRVSITSFNGCYLGYVVPSQYDDLDNYETRTMCWFGPYFGDYLADVMIRMVSF